MTAGALSARPSPVPGQSQRAGAAVRVSVIAELVVCEIQLRVLVWRSEVKDANLTFTPGPQGESSDQQRMCLLQIINKDNNIIYIQSNICGIFAQYTICFYRYLHSLNSVQFCGFAVFRPL